MPRRRDKRTDTQNSDDYQEAQAKEKVVHFGTVRFNRMLAPDQIEGDDYSKYSILAWSNTLQAQRLLPWNERKQLFQRALSFLPFSYKIWKMYLDEFVDFCSSRSLLSKQYTQLNEVFQQALVKLPKMPRIWLMYAQTLEKQYLISKVRFVYNWSLRNLPLTQHQKIWHKFSLWSMKLDNTATALKVVPRYLKLNPDFKQNFAQYLKQRDLIDHSVKIIQQILQDDGYNSKSGKSKQDFYIEMVELISTKPQKIVSFQGDVLIREGIKRYPEQSGKLWVKLSDYYIRLGQFDKARDILQEALNQIDNAKNFGIIFNAYCKFEEEMITALANEQIRSHYNVVEADNVDYEIDYRMQKLQSLIQRQPYLLHRINIRKNPHQIRPWLGLIALYKNSTKLNQCIKTIKEAIQKINPQEAEGRYSQIWIEYSKILQQNGAIKECNEVLYEATQVNFKMIEDYLQIWIRWIQMLLQQQYHDDALRVVKNVLFRKKSQTSVQIEGKLKNIDELLKSNTTLWQLYIDIEISIGNFQSTKTAYQRCKEHKCLTPIMLLNFTNFIWDAAYFQQTFRVFQFAVSNFKWPALYDIWISYIHKFISRYGSTVVGVERARSMFERLLKQMPKQYSGIFYFMYAEFEEQYGLYSHAVDIYDRMVNNVPVEERYQAYTIYISKVSKMLGITKTRAIFESALQKLKQKEILDLGRKYAELQTNLGQIQRARAVFSYISQFTDPRDDDDRLWGQWERFEVQFGDKQSYKQYLRIKRSVESKYAMLPPDLDKIERNVKEGLA